MPRIKMNVFTFIRISCIVLVANLLCVNGFSQSVGPKLGVSISKMAQNFASQDDEFDEEFYSLGLQVGVTSTLPIGYNFLISPELYFIQKGGVLSDKASNTKQVRDINYIELPVYVAYEYGISDFEARFKAGPYLAYAISGKILSASSGTDTEGDLTFKNSVTNDDIANSTTGGVGFLRNIDYGLNFGIDLQYQAFVLSGVYSMGLNNLVPEFDADPDAVKNKIFNRSFQFSVAYLFGTTGSAGNLRGNIKNEYRKHHRAPKRRLPNRRRRR